MEYLNHFHVIMMISLRLCVSYFCCKVYEFIWRRPKRLEKSLRQQGINGSPYKLGLMGDMKEYINQITEAWSKPISLGHDQVVQRVDPFNHSMVQKYGKVSFYWSGTKPSLTIMDPKLIKEVLTNKQGHIQKPSLNSSILILTRGLTALQGEKWSAHRRIINPAFHFEKLKGMVPVFVDCSALLVEKWKKSMTNGGGWEVDIWPEMQELTGNVISRTAFGSNYREGKEILKLQIELQKLIVPVPDTNMYDNMFGFIPTKKNQRREELNQKITSMLRSLVEGKKRMMEATKGNEDNLLSLLLQSNAGNDSPVSVSNYRMTMDEIVEECKEFYLAGHETTSSWLTWTVIVLAMHQDWQQKAREEVLKLCGDKDPNAEIISQLKTVNMILNEVLRLYPPVIALYQQAHNDTKIGDIDLKAGIDLLLPIMLVNRDPDLWGDDVQEFKPERFSEGVSKACKDPAAFLPFGWGPRKCIGENFATIEAKVALAMILKHFAFELSASYTHAPHTVMTLQPQHGAQVVLHQI